MQDVTITAPKTAAISLPQIASWLAVANAIKDELVALKQPLPGALADGITKLNNIATAFAGGLVPPNSIDKDLSDLLVIFKAVENETGKNVLGGGVQNLIAAVTWTQAGIANLENGQFAVLASSHIELQGELVPVCAAIFRTDKGAAAIDAGFVEGPLSGETVAAADYDALQAKYDALVQQHQGAESTIANLQASGGAAGAQVIDLQTKLDAATSQVSTLEAQLTAAQAEITKLEAAAQQAPPAPPAQ